MILTLKSSGFIEAGILFVYENNGKEFFRFISFKDEELDGKNFI